MFSFFFFFYAQWVNGDIANLTQVYDNYFADTLQYRMN